MNHISLVPCSPFRHFGHFQDCIAAAEKAVQIFDGMGAEGSLTESQIIYQSQSSQKDMYMFILWYVMIFYDYLLVFHDIL